MIYQVFHKEDLYNVCIKDNARIRSIGVGPAVPFCERNGILSDFSAPDNISHLNHLLSEWTAIYRLWRNIRLLDDKDGWIGLCHYRRPPVGCLVAGDCGAVGSLLEKCDLISWIPNGNSLASQCAKDHPGLMELMASSLSACHGGDCAKRFMLMSGLSTLHPFSLCFIMSKPAFAAFAEWSWKVLELLVFASESDNTVMAGFDTKAPRGIGYIAERLLPVWCFLNEMNVVYMMQGGYPYLSSLVENKLRESECAISS